MKTLVDCFFVGAGGALGAVGRYLIGLIPIRPENGFPLTTLLINVVGALAIGFLVAATEKNSAFDPRLLLFLKVGLCGGFTTFSTFSQESAQLRQSGKPGLGLLYATLSVLLCVAAVFGAQQIVK